MNTFKTKREAIAAANILRAEGQQCKVYKEVRTYTIPFKGVETSISYFVK